MKKGLTIGVAIIIIISVIALSATLVTEYSETENQDIFEKISVDETVNEGKKSFSLELHDSVALTEP